MGDQRSNIKRRYRNVIAVVDDLRRPHQQLHQVSFLREACDALLHQREHHAAWICGVLLYKLVLGGIIAGFTEPSSACFCGWYQNRFSWQWAWVFDRRPEGEREYLVTGLTTD